MSAPDFSLLTRRRYAPLFTVQFLTAMNDNLLKFALLFLANFTLYRADPARAATLATVSTGLFILPYFLLSGLAGQMADAWDKAWLIRAVKGAEIAIMALALVGFWFESVPVLLSCLFLMGVHSTVFGPVKYSILPQHLHPHELMGGTGLVEAGTFVAILTGQLLGGIIPPWEAGMVAFGFAVLGFVAAWAVPRAPSAAPGMRIDLNPLRSTAAILRAAHGGRGVWLAILGISWFFSVGAVVLSEFAPLVAGTLNAAPEVVTLFLAVFSLSVAAGSLLVNRLLRGEVSARYVPIAAVGLAVFLIDLWLTSRRFVVETPGADIAAFLATPGSWHLLVDLAGIALSGGVFVVPLYTILQTWSPAGKRSQVIAANNVVNAIVTVLLVAVATAMLAGGGSVPGIFAALGFATLSIALISCWLLPDAVFEAAVRAMLRLARRVEVTGLEHVPAPGERAVVEVVGHGTFREGVLLAAFLPGKPIFAIHRHLARAWWLQPLRKLFDIVPVDPIDPMSGEAMVAAVREGRWLVVLPEGRITVPGAGMTMVGGPDGIARRTDAAIVPVRIDGGARRRWFSKIALTVLPQRSPGA